MNNFKTPYVLLVKTFDNFLGVFLPKLAAEFAALFLAIYLQVNRAGRYPLQFVDFWRGQGIYWTKVNC